MGYTGWALRVTQGGLGDIQTGRCKAYTAAERSETGKLNNLCSLQFLVQKSRLYKNSDLKSKWNTVTAYILLSDSEQVK